MKYLSPRLAFDRQDDLEKLVVGAEYIKLIWVPDTFFVNEKIALFHQVCCNLHAWNFCECVNCYCYMLHAWVKCQMCQMLYIQNFVTWRFDGKFSNHQPQLIGLWLGCNNCNGIPTKMSSNISLIVIVLTNDIVGYCYWVERYSLITTATSGSVHQPNLIISFSFPEQGSTPALF